MNNIYFIGMPGCGKSTLVKYLSDKSKKIYIDSDRYLEEKMQMKIPEIFEIKGEEYFRNCESECLFEISKNSGILVATGGGIVKRKKNVDIMKNSGKIVYINTPPEVILKNSALENRPLLKDKSEIFKLYESRKELYLSAADFVIENVGTISEAAQKIENIFS